MRQLVVVAATVTVIHVHLPGGLTIPLLLFDVPPAVVAGVLVSLAALSLVLVVAVTGGDR